MFPNFLYFLHFFPHRPLAIFSLVFPGLASLLHNHQHHGDIPSPIISLVVQERSGHQWFGRTRRPSGQQAARGGLCTGLILNVLPTFSFSTSYLRKWFMVLRDGCSHGYLFFSCPRNFCLSSNTVFWALLAERGSGRWLGYWAIDMAGQGVWKWSPTVPPVARVTFTGALPSGVSGKACLLSTAFLSCKTHR